MRPRDDLTPRVEDFRGDAGEWDRFVASMDGSGYLAHDWRGILGRGMGHETQYLAARAGSELRGILPLVRMRSRLFGNFLVSLPFVTHGGLLCRDEAAGTALLAAAGNLRQELGAAYVELRHASGMGLELPARTHKVAMVLPLGADEAAMWRGLNTKVRNQVRKAEKSGLRTVQGGRELLDDFYGVFARNMRDLGTPVLARSFFAQVLWAFPHGTRILSVRLGDRAVAAGFLYWHGNTLEIPWASSIREHNHLCPNNLLYWETIRTGLALGLTRFDLGRSSPGAGTFKFKEQWGARPQALSWHYLLPPGRALPDLTPSNPRYALAINAWRRLPVPLTRLVGPAVVRCIP